MNLLVTTAAVAASSPVASATEASGAPDLRALHSYAAWLHMERRLLCTELWPHMSADAERYVWADNAGYNWHLAGDVNWRDKPRPSSRAAAVLDLVGVDWRAPRDWDCGLNHEDDGARPALPQGWPASPRQAVHGAGDYPDPVFELIEDHKRANAEYSDALEIVPGTLNPDPVKEEHFGNRESDARGELACTVPTTLDGLLAVLTYVVGVSEGKFSFSGRHDNTFDEELLNILISAQDCLKAHLSEGKAA
jgi:hypothetical protein